MSLRKFIPVLVAALLISVAVMVMGASAVDKALVAAAAAFFTVAMIAVSLVINIAAWRQPEIARDPRQALGLFRRNTRLVALVYAWGAAGLLAIYSVSGLTWRHGWQYGLAMALIAAMLVAYVQRLGRAPELQPAPAWLTLLHAAAAASGLLFLVTSGKLDTVKRDWAANDIFLAGGAAIVILSLISALSQWRSRQGG